MPHTPPIRIELPTIFGMTTVNCYLFLEPVPTLIDCGEKTAASWKALNDALAEYGLKISDIKRLIITHAHVDHIGMAGKIVAASACEVWVSDYVYPWAVNLAEMRQQRIDLIDELLELAGEHPHIPIKQHFLSFMEGFRKNWDPIPVNHVKRFAVDETLEIGGLDWEVIYTPGHCINQTCFYQAEQKALISADMLLKITPTPASDLTLEAPFQRVKALPLMLQSYQKIAALDIERVYPGHYKTFSNHLDLITKQTTRIEKRKQECLVIIQNGASNFFDILNGLYKNRFSPPAFPMLMGYLDLLLEDGAITTVTTGKTITYQAT